MVISKRLRFWPRVLKAITNPNRTLFQKFLTLNKLLSTKIKKICRIRIWIKPTPSWRHTGWGMATSTALPWERDSSTDLTGIQFAEVNQLLLNKIKNNSFILSQWQYEGGGYRAEPSKLLDDLLWRHYLVYWTAKFSTRFTSSSRCNLVEAGVCDGLTVNFAISAVESELGKDAHFEVFLYDAWAEMKKEFLTETENLNIGDYAYLSIEQTKSNLNASNDRCSFIKGYIPNVFIENPGPDEISWLHIDLNSSMPTLKTLEHFLPKLLPGGIVLFDDYGKNRYEETKAVADKFCSQFDGLLMPFPTGQAIFFKH